MCNTPLPTPHYRQLDQPGIKATAGVAGVAGAAAAGQQDTGDNNPSVDLADVRAHARTNETKRILGWAVGIDTQPLLNVGANVIATKTFN